MSGSTSSDSDDFKRPELVASNQKIARVVRVRGNNLFEVETPDKSKLLMVIPNQLRQVVWVDVGAFVLVEHTDAGNKVKVDMVELFTIERIYIYKMENAWPKEFNICLDLWRDSVFRFNNRRVPSMHLRTSSDSDSSSGSEDDSDDSSEFNESYTCDCSDSGADCSDEET